MEQEVGSYELGIGNWGLGIGDWGLELELGLVTKKWV